MESDAEALRAGALEGRSQFSDPGRGQGLKQVVSRVGRWGGRMAIRSGAAQLVDATAYPDPPEIRTNLAFFPGSQISIEIPPQPSGR